LTRTYKHQQLYNYHVDYTGLLSITATQNFSTKFINVSPTFTGREPTLLARILCRTKQSLVKVSMPHDSYPIILNEKIRGNSLIGGRATTLIPIGVV
jgi:hypothetical protein